MLFSNLTFSPKFFEKVSTSILFIYIFFFHYIKLVFCNRAKLISYLSYLIDILLKKAQLRDCCVVQSSHIVFFNQILI